MGLEYTTLRDEKEQERMAGAWTADRTLWLDSNDNVVEDGDPKAHYLLCRAGRRVEAGTVERYGLKNKPKPRAKKTAKPKG